MCTCMRCWTAGSMIEGEALVRAEPFHAIELRLSVLWGR